MDKQDKFIKALRNLAYPVCIVSNAEEGESNAITVSSMTCLLYTSPSPRDRTRSRMPSSA